MGNGFLVLDENDWEHATPEQRDWMVFKTLKSMDGRLKSLEEEKSGSKRLWTDRVCSFLGGIIGGAAAWLGIKVGG
ncbi:MAG: hypothetical protein A4E65_00809 [Syntrophorhabdus sp. PtaU1.Bin153]|nr:MAG: hypothetical protein A4E65_00809 [Syntrophorhabdus sp. PtaU1.Bin153]